MNRQQATPAQRRVDLRDDAATQGFGKRLAALLQPGDAIMLSGDLGAGKSTLARAAIKALIGEDEAVPSPTFTITQRYETATATIVHADLYRLGDPDELIEIGLEDDFASAITFVEWPGLLGDAMPDERIEITLDFAPGDGRVALLSGHGIRPAAILSALCDDRDALRLAFVALGGWSDAESQALDGDASRRRYFRLRRPGEGGILMDAPPLTDGSAPAFEHVTRLLRQRALSAPEILHAAAEDGFLLLEDLGDDLYSRLCAASPEGERGWYETAVDLLHHLGVTSTASLPPYDVSTLLREAALLTDWWIPAAGGDASPDLRAEYLGLMQEATAGVAAERSALVLRDYHADNLLWLPEREGVARVGLLDYQDALLGHPAYDLVSLLEDARRDVAPDLAAAMIERFLTTRQDLDRQAFRAAYDVLGAQRNAKIVGIFARLCLRDGKPRYLDLIPRVWIHLQRDLAAPELASLRGFFERRVPAPEPAILARIGRSVAA